MSLITSQSNATVKEIRALHRRREREESGLYLIEGIRIVGEAVEAHAPIERCIVAPNLLTSAFAQSLVQTLRERAVPCLEVSAPVFRSLAMRENPQGIAAVLRQHWERLDDIQPESALCWIALSEVADPGNLGTILRTSDAVGAGGAILLGSSTDPYDPAALRASMGAIFSQTLVRSDEASFLRWQRDHGLHLVGTSDAAATDYRALGYPRPLLLWMGSERHGLSPEQQARCDVVARIPMVGCSDSLNLAVATGVMLYQIFNRHHPLDTTPR